MNANAHKENPAQNKGKCQPNPWRILLFVQSSEQQSWEGLGMSLLPWEGLSTGSKLRLKTGPHSLPGWLASLSEALLSSSQECTSFIQCLSFGPFHLHTIGLGNTVCTVGRNLVGKSGLLTLLSLLHCTSMLPAIAELLCPTPWHLGSSMTCYSSSYAVFPSVSKQSYSSCTKLCRTGI